MKIKCLPPTPTCTTGQDKICSDGKCYKANDQCPSGTYLVSSDSCKCLSACSGSTVNSKLQVNLQRNKNWNYFIKKNKNKNLKCFIPQTSNCSLGLDKICSDGYCYPNATSCPTGTSQVSNGTCLCSSCLNGTCPSSCTSSLQVF